MSEHVCHVPYCHTTVKPTLLMCPMHWAKVPSSLKAAVTEAYRKGQCDDRKPSREWFEAARAAVGSVADD